MRGFRRALTGAANAARNAIKDAQLRASGTAEHIQRFFTETAGHIVEQGRSALASLRSTFTRLVHGLQRFQWSQIPAAIINHIKKHPKTTLLQLICLLAIICPGIFAVPLLAILGFAVVGPVAGGLAATFQSVFGTPVAFSTLQSAAMGGAGMAVLLPVIQVFAAVVFVAAEVYKWQSKEGDNKNDKEKKAQ
ncbi:hypothetical protein PRZ48_013724 [Zasmidium cellare]|uniref:Uncharacterized protein n=1 Tax=Zasmidium cellare TaxID=395010 RepID=A0ABR0E1V1_ZASCE|nr:hypothetical protein PRZ48_013724 [Zasmidium cellare]